MQHQDDQNYKIWRSQSKENFFQKFMSQDQQGQLFQTKLNEISLEDIFESNCLTKLDDQRV